ncbi:unnamed protein product [Blepharisma stoltei]|uniref:Uncharacterized protein n=1 Tax=Blepharisma stoltei TaxID=1481888 RepID=A0AAU9K743_9CILI|nr:unnamed protein product [Blepharisma stoltei]
MVDQITKSLFYRLDYYFWPYIATNKLSMTIFIGRKWWAVYRSICTIICLILFGFSIILSSSFKFLLQFGSWSMILTLLFFFLLLINYHYKKLWKLTHILYEMTWCFNWTSVIIHWGIIFWMQPEGSNLYITVGLHGGLLILLILESLNNQIWFYARHLYIICILSLLYFIMIMTYSLAVEKIYDSFSFKDAKTYLILLTSLIIIILSFISGSILDKFKSRHAAIEVIPENGYTYDELQDTTKSFK